LTTFSIERTGGCGCFTRPVTTRLSSECWDRKGPSDPGPLALHRRPNPPRPRHRQQWHARRAPLCPSIAERYAYDAYGKPTILTPTFTSRTTSSYQWEIRYAGYRYDDEVEWYHVRHCNLLPRLGRWNRRDPVGYWAGRNRYTYVDESPLSSLDPYGLQKCTPVGKPVIDSPWRVLSVDPSDVAGGGSGYVATEITCWAQRRIKQRFRCCDNGKVWYEWRRRGQVVAIRFATRKIINVGQWVDPSPLWNPLLWTRIWYILPESRPTAEQDCLRELRIRGSNLDPK